MWGTRFNRFGGWSMPDLETLQSRVNRLFSDTATGHIAPEFPAINIFSGKDDAIVTAEIPGVDPDELDISVKGETVTLRGSRNALELKEDECFHRQERGAGQFVRSFELPFRVEADKVEAAYQKGVLQLRLPRAEEDKPKKISVKTS